LRQVVDRRAVGDAEQAARAANEAVRQLERYFRDLLQERQRRPGDDLMSLLLQGQAEGRLTAEEVTSQCILLLNAGHLTTMDQFGRGKGVRTLFSTMKSEKGS
jgi:cytochrome P450